MAYYETWLFRLSPWVGKCLILCARNATRRTVYRWGGLPRRLSDLCIMEGWTHGQMQRYQDAAVQKLVEFSARNVPYYRELFARAGRAPDAVRSVAELERIPLLDKAQVRRAPEHFLADGRKPTWLARGFTSGSTGSPLPLYRDLESICLEEARLVRWRRRAGIEPHDRRVIIRGANFAPTGQQRGRAWLHDWPGRLMFVSSYHLADEWLPRIVRAITRFRPAALEGYPGSLVVLARYLQRRGIQLPVRAVLTSSEQLYAHQRRFLAQAFEADVFDQYGMAERVVSGSECRQHRLHVDWECGVLEVVRPDGTRCEPGESGEIVGTCLTNYAMPLIRYQTGDIGRVGTERCACGLQSPYIDALQGRDDDMVIGSDGRRFAPTILTFPFETAEGVEESQIVQRGPGRLLIRLVPAATYSDPQLRAARSFIRADLHKRLGGRVSIEFEITRRLEKDASGKFRWIATEKSEKNHEVLNCER